MENWLFLETSCGGKFLDQLSIRLVPFFNYMTLHKATHEL